MGPYAVSKAALEALVKTYALEVAESNVRVNMINPGPVRTMMRSRACPGENPDTLPPPVGQLAIVLPPSVNVPLDVSPMVMTVPAVTLFQTTGRPPNVEPQFCAVEVVT
jgi:NAD(P)-dependent dehydrogenase (short-subunit alcohol dehydrogenase family)